MPDKKTNTKLNPKDIAKAVGGHVGTTLSKVVMTEKYGPEYLYEGRYDKVKNPLWDKEYRDKYQKIKESEGTIGFLSNLLKDYSSLGSEITGARIKGFMLDALAYGSGQIPGSSNNTSVTYGPSVMGYSYQGMSQDNSTAEKREIWKDQIKDGYVDGYKGLGPGAKSIFDEKYGDKMKGFSDLQKDEFYKNTVFKDMYKDRTDEEGKKIYENRFNMTKAERDLYVGREYAKRNEEYKAKKPNILSNVLGVQTQYGKWEEDVETLVTPLVNKKREEYVGNIKNVTGEDRKKLLQDFDKLANETSNLWKEYKDDKGRINFSEDEKLELLAKFYADIETAGAHYAYRKFTNAIQDEVADNQTILEKFWNSQVQFTTSFVGDLAAAAGIVYGLLGSTYTSITGNVAPGMDTNKNWFQNIWGNDVVEWGNLLAETQSFNWDEQHRLSEAGLQANPILNTVSQENSLISGNTIWNLQGQTGYTVASTVASFGYGAAVKGLVKGARLLSSVEKLQKTGRTINEVRKLNSRLRNIQRFEKSANLMIPALVGTSEGAMEAVSTSRQFMQDKEAEINNKYFDKAKKDIEARVRANPRAAAELLRSMGYEVPDKIGKSTEGSSSPAYTEDEIKKIATLLSESDEVVNRELQKYQKDINEDLAVAEDNANTAGSINFVGNSFINGALNSTLKLSWQSPRVQKFFNAGRSKNTLSRNGINIGPNAAGKTVATYEKATRRTILKEKFKEALGEGLEEYTQGLSDAFAQGYSNSNFEQYLSNKYELGKSSKEATNTSFLRNFMGGVAGASNELVSFESMQSFLYGALSMAIPTPNMSVNYRTGNRGEAKRMEGESRLDYLKRRNPIGFRSMLSPLFSNREVDIENKKREAVANSINEFLAKDGTAESLFNIANTNEFLRRRNEAARNGDEKVFRDNSNSVLFSQVVTLNDLQGTDYYDSVIEALKNRSELNEADLQDENSEASNIAREMQETAKKNYGIELSTEEALNTAKKNATEMLATIEDVKKETEQVENLFGENIDKDVKEGLVYQRIAIKDRLERLQTLESEIGQIRAKVDSNPASPTKPSNLSDTSKQVLAKFGSYKKAQEELEELKKAEQDMQESVKEIKQAAKTGKVTNKKTGEVEELTEEERKEVKSSLALFERELNSLKSTRKNVEESLKGYTEDNANYTTNENNELALSEEAKVLSAKEILELDAESRAMMLDPKNKSKYSEAQQVEIDRANAIGNSEATNFNSKIQDAARLKADYIENIRMQNEMMLNPMSFSIMANDIKSKALINLKKKQYEYLLNDEYEDDYEKFASELDRIEDEGDQITLRAVDQLLGDSEFYKKYKSDRSNIFKFLKAIQSDDSNPIHSLSDNGKNLMVDAIRFLINKGIDLNNLSSEDKKVLDNIVSELSSHTNLNGETINEFEDYLKSIHNEKDTPVINNIERDLINPLREVIKHFLKEEANKQENKEAINPSEASSNQSNPTPKPDPKDNSNKDQEGQREKPKTPVERVRESSGETMAKIFEMALERAKVYIENSSTDTSTALSREAAQKVVERILENISNSTLGSVDDLITEYNLNLSNIDTLISELGIDSSLKESIYYLLGNTKGLLRQYLQDQFEKLTGSRTRLSDYGRSSLLNGGSLVQNNSIQSLDIEKMRARHPDSPIVKFYDNYKIEEFLKSSSFRNVIANNKNSPVVFISDSNLNEQVKQDLLNKNIAYTPTVNSPIIAAVEVKSGGIEINGKYYQPIAVMPSSGNPSFSGSAHLAKLRNLIGNTGKTSLITDEEGKVIKTSFTGDFQKKGIEFLKKGEPRPLAIEVLLRDSKEVGSQASPTRLMKHFLSRVTRGKIGGRTALVYNIPGIGTDNDIPVEIYTREVSRTTNSEGTLLTRLLNSVSLDPTSDQYSEDAIKSIINFNSRTRGFSTELYRFLKSFNLADYTIVDSNGAVKIADNKVEEFNKAAQKLSEKLSNYITLPSGYSYGLSVNSDGAINIQVNGNLGTIQLGNISGRDISNNELASVIKNLIIDNRGATRITNRGTEFTKWGVSYNHFGSNNSLDIKDTENIFNDNILEVGTNSFITKISGVTLNNPLPDPINEGPKESPIRDVKDADSGVVLNIETEASNPSAKETAMKKLDKILRVSKVIQLSPDGSRYINTVTGTTYTRTTSIIAADNTAEGRFDPNNPWVTPSTFFGNAVDELTRDFFSETPIREEYKGKVIFAESGSGKTSIADNKTVFDFGHILGKSIEKITGKKVYAEDASMTLNKLDITTQEQVLANANSEVSRLKSENKTILIGSVSLAERMNLTTDAVFMNESVEESNSRTSRTDRLNRFDRLSYHQKSREKLNSYIESRGIKDKVQVLGKDEYLGHKILSDSSFKKSTLWRSVFTNEQYHKFVEQLEQLGEQFKAKGLTIVPRNVLATGTVTVNNEDGTSQTINVAGTLDLLAYDEAGNFHIFDMKTRHSPTVDEKLAKKWARQLYAYKAFLQNAYGINVKSTSIIKIDVPYPSPSSKVEYSLNEDENTLLLNGTPFSQANQGNNIFNGKFLSVLPINTESLLQNGLDIRRSKLTDTEVEMLDNFKGLDDSSKASELELPETSGTRSIGGINISNTRSRRRRKGPMTTGNPIEEKPVVIQEKLQWNNLAEDVKEYITKKHGVTEETWKNWNEDCRLKLLGCMGK